MKNNLKIDTSKFAGISADSRHIEPGYIYVSIKGTHFDGDNFATDAVSKGAKLVVTRSDSSLTLDGTEVIKVTDTRKALAEIANSMFQPQPEKIAAVTGTSGKTSVAFFYKQFAELLGSKSASIGTLGVVSNFVSFPHDDTLTSPDPITLNKILQTCAQKGISHVCMEASSHGIDQHRMDAIKIPSAAFTNISQDHLDYHKDMQEYLDTKIRLFTEILAPGGEAWINADLKESEYVISEVSKRKDINVRTYGKNGKDIKFVSIYNYSLALEIMGDLYAAKFYPEGSFQSYNLMAALGMAISNGLDTAKLMESVPEIKAAPGRLEQVATYNGAKVFVDYAHKPDALEKALAALRGDCKGKLYVIFGCGGDRDKKKRPIMGEIAQRLADVAVVTDDNPRTEDAATIRKEVMVGCPNAVEYDSRAKAISSTMQQLKDGDILLIAGKGHETYQIIGTETVYFSDNEEVMKVVLAG